MTDEIPGHAPSSANQLPPHAAGPQRRLRSRIALGPLLPGLVLLILGLVFLLDNLDLVESWAVLRFWPVLPLVGGLKMLVDARDRGSAVSGTLLAAVGALLLLDALYLIDVNLWDFWPLVLVALGARVLMNVLADPDDAAVVSDSEEAASAFLGAIERRNRSADFRGGSASAFMGGVNLDLREADIAGERAVIQVFAMMGGLEIKVPEEWTVEVGVTSIMGGVEDKTRGAAATPKRLVLKGTVIMGGIEIRN